MGKNAIGNASIVLIFAVLCLMIFTTMSYLCAITEQKFIREEVEAIKLFWENPQ
jgi:hypothetical protein